MISENAVLFTMLCTSMFFFYATHRGLTVAASSCERTPPLRACGNCSEPTGRLPRGLTAGQSFQRAKVFHWEIYDSTQ